MLTQKTAGTAGGNDVYFCTYFDANYLDKGLALAHSLERVSGAYTLYVLALDEKCEAVLKSEAPPHVTVLSLNEFETPAQRELRAGRRLAEYYWSLTPSLVQYLLARYELPECTYIDADMRFFSDPAPMLQALADAGASVGVVEHGFRDSVRGRNLVRNFGPYCVEFNTFVNDERGAAALAWWRARCEESTSVETGGDQKYLSDWTERFPGVYVHKNAGGGVAPWNIGKYALVPAGKKQKPEGVRLREKHRKEVFPLVFYHYHKLVYLADGTVDTCVAQFPGYPSRALLHAVYDPYLREIEILRTMLSEKYGLSFPPKSAVLTTVPGAHSLKEKCRALLCAKPWEIADELLRARRRRTSDRIDLSRLTGR